MAIRPAPMPGHNPRESDGAERPVDRPRPGANQYGMTDAAAGGDGWVPRLGLLDGVSADRAALVQGLFELAAWVVDQPAVQVPRVTASLRAACGDWDSRCRVVDEVAAALDVSAAFDLRPVTSRYWAETWFGPVRVCSHAFSDERMAGDFGLLTGCGAACSTERAALRAAGGSR